MGHWRMVPGWISNGTMPRTTPVSCVAASTSPMPSARSLIHNGSSPRTRGRNMARIAAGCSA